MLKIARILALGLVLICSGTFGADVVQAQISPFSTKPTCPIAASPKTCTYPNGQTATCTERTTGFSTTLECTNPDNSKTVCVQSVDIEGTGGNTNNQCTVTNADGTSGGSTNTTNDSSGIATTTTDSTGATTREVSERESPGTCSWTSIGVCFQNLPGMLLVGIAFLFLHLAALVLFLAGTLFNWVVLRTVFQFGEYFGSSQGMLDAWGVMRDIANIGLLFAFVLIGIMLILNIEGRGGGASAKKAIPRLIIFAVLLNFSLFAAQAVIDVANAFGSTFTTLAQENCSAQASTEQGGGQSLEECAVNNGISGRIMQAAGLSGIYGDTRAEGDGAAAWSNFTNRPYSYSVSLIMLSIFVLVSALVLLAGAIMLIFRTVVLSFLMITSPIGFAGMVIPGMSKIAKDWWNTLIKQSFFAPAYLLLIFISIKMTENLMGGEATLANAVIADAGNAVAGNVQVVMVFLIVIGFMLGSLILANRMGAMGAKLATNTASAVVLGGTARGMSFATGGSARYLRGRIQNSRFKDAPLARVAVNRALRPLEGASLDARRIPGVSNTLKRAGAGDAAAPAKNIAYANQVAWVEKRMKTGENLNKQYDKERDSIEKENNFKELRAAAKRTLEEGEERFTSEQKNLLRKQGEKGLAQLGDLENFAGEIAGAQFDALMKGTELTDDQKGQLKKARIDSLTAAAATMSAQDLESALKNANFNEVEKGKIKQARFATLDTAVTTATQAGPQAPNATELTQAVKNEVKSLSKKDLDILPTTVVTNTMFLDSLSDSQRDDLIASAARTAAEKVAVQSSYNYEKINAAFKAAGGGQPAAAAAAAQIQTLQPKQVAKLDKDILTNPQASGALANASVLEALQKESRLNIADRQSIGRNIRANPVVMQNPQFQNYLNGPAGAMW